MMRTDRFAKPSGRVTCRLESGDELELPIFAGILRHPRAEELPRLLADPAVARRYTCRALQIAAWPILREFPRSWLLGCLPAAELEPGRRRALEFMLGTS